VAPDGRIHIDSSLKAESLQRRDVLKTTDGTDRSILPDARLVYIAGCVFDAGAKSLMRYVDWILDHPDPAIIAVGGGERAAHVAMIAKDCGVPTGGIAQVVASCEEMNATVLAALLADRGVPLARDHIWDVPFLLRCGMLPIILAVPPYSLWEPPVNGGLPEHGSLFGVERLAEAFGIGGVIPCHADGCGGCE